MRGDTLYGHEWLADVTEAVKVLAETEAVYRVTYADLQAQGWSNVRGAELGVVAVGEDVSAYLTTEAAWTDDDYLEFVATPRDFVDYEAEMFGTTPDGLLDPYRLAVTDRLPYFVVRRAQPGPRLVEVAATPPAGSAPLTTLYAEAIVPPTNAAFHKVETDRFGSRYSSFRMGEGFANVTARNNHLLRSTLPQKIREGDTWIEHRSITNKNDGLDRIRHLIVEDSVRVRDTVGSNVFRIDTLQLGNFQLSGPRLDFRVAGQNGRGDRYALGLTVFHYEAQIDAAPGVQLLRHTGAQAVDAAIAITGLTAGERYRVYDASSGRYTAFTAGGTDEEAYLGTLPAYTRVHVSSDGAAVRAALTPVQLAPLPTGPLDYLVVASERMAQWSTTPSDYAAFRSSALGGNHRAFVWDVEGLYDRFGYGFPRDARAVRNAVQYLNATQPLRHVLILGKGREFTRVRTEALRADALNASFFVPTYGLPGSDNLLAVNALTDRPTVAIGRLPVEDEAELATVLGKAQRVEQARNNSQTVEEKAWMKRVIHLGGGTNSAEQTSIKSNLEAMERRLRQTEFAPTFFSLYKDSDSPIQQVENSALFDFINDGASFLTFFGHSSPGSFDFNVDDPDDYDNRDRLPVMISLGCLAGNMHAPGKSAGERFVVTTDKVAVGFAATTGLGFVTQLQGYASTFYGAFGDIDAGLSVGESLLASNRFAASSTSPVYQQLAEQYTYHGDPAVRLYKFDGPDYVFGRESFALATPDLAFGVDSVSASVVLYNLGAAVADTVTVLVERSSTSRARTTVDSITLAGPFGATTPISTTFDSWLIDGVGLNQLYFTVTSTRQQELPRPAALQNNTLGPLEFFIRSDEVDLLWPPRLAEVPSDSAVAYVSTRAPFGDDVSLRLELSPTPRFEPTTTRSVTSSGRSLIDFDLRSEVAPGQTYFWRVAYPSGDSTALTEARSFSVASAAPTQASTVWAHSDLAHYRLGTDLGLYPDSTGQWQRRNGGFFARLINRRDGVENTRFSINFGAVGSTVLPSAGRDYPGFAVAVSRAGTNSFVRATDVGISDARGTSSDNVIFYSANDSLSMLGFVDLLSNQLAPGDHLWVWALESGSRAFDPASWYLDSLGVDNASVEEVLGDLGATQFSGFVADPRQLYSFIYRVGDGVIDETLAPSTEVYTREVFVETAGAPGTFQSTPLVGFERVEALEYAIAVDSLAFEGKVTVCATDTDGNEVAVDSSTLASYVFDLSTRQQPSWREVYVKLTTPGGDSLAVPRFERLTASYAPLPEVVYDASRLLELSRDSTLSGAPITMRVGVTNVSPTPAGPVELNLQYLTAAGSARSDSARSLSGWGEIDMQVDLDSRGTVGEQVLLATLATTQRRELLEANNQASLRKTLLSDGTAPRISVLLNGEPPTPGFNLVSDVLVRIDFRDNDAFGDLTVDNLVLGLTDEETGVQFSGSALPGVVELVDREQSAGRATAAFEYDPGVLPDGKYLLRVRARDAAQNSAAGELVVRLEVANATAVSNVLPYPNPFVDALRFQYEVTGTPPLDYQVDIYTSSGRVVNSLGPADLGPLTVGRNLTEGAWDGTDAYGQPLAKGVYLYRFSVLHDEPAEAEHRATAIDDFIQSGFGKLVKL